MAEIERLLIETQRWRAHYARLRDGARTTGERHKHSIEAAACAIREQAFLDAVKSLQEQNRATPPQQGQER